MKHSLYLLSTLLLVAFCNAAEIDTMRARRTSQIVGATTESTSVDAWLASLGADGKWPDGEINYTTGCDAQRASWPAGLHFRRINTLAAAYHGGFKNNLDKAGDPQLRAAISRALNYWFSRDFTVPACLDSGNTPACPCGTPGFWNTNWNSNIILVPTWVGQICLLLGDSLTTSERASCTKITTRSYNTLQTGINGVTNITGANLLDIAGIGIDLALLTGDTGIIATAYNKVYDEMAVRNGIKADGIREDGSFGQHAGILYNGNYGKDYHNNVINLALIAAGTQYQAGAAAKSTFVKLFDANQWMVFYNSITETPHWDYSVLGRFLVMPVADNQATQHLKTNLTQLQQLAEAWNSPQLLDIHAKLSGQPSNSNLGGITGNRMFYANDYMVHRGPGYVTTLKMFSRRTQNTECTNSQNPLGFHLSDGASYNYITGNEYEDTFAVWDWNKIPGTTVDYEATPLTCETARQTGNQPYVGGVSTGSVGLAVMRHRNPITASLEYRKTWFFLDDGVQYVMIARITSTTAAPVYSILDQKRRTGDIFVSGTVQGSGDYTQVSSLWHGGVGYTFNATNPAASLSVRAESRTGSWQAIGTSDEPPVTVNMFTAWLHHQDIAASVAYGVYPATSSFAAFQQKSQASRIQAVRNDGSISALVDSANKKVYMATFVDGGNTSLNFPAFNTGEARLTIRPSSSCALIVNLNTWAVTLSDPTQTFTTVTVTFTLAATGNLPPGWTGARTKTLEFTLPSGGEVGNSVTLPLNGALVRRSHFSRRHH